MSSAEPTVAEGERRREIIPTSEADEGEELKIKVVVPTRLRPEAMPFVPEVVARDGQDKVMVRQPHVGRQILHCDKHYYGKNCTETCSENCVDQLCNMTDGVCLSCPVGRLGDFCDEACSDTTFGPNCKQQCDPDCVYAAIENKRLCDVITGDCVLKSKFPADPNVPKDVAETGLPREKLNSQDKDSIEDKVDTYILYLLIVLLALLIAILVICIFIRRKRKTVKTEAVEDTSVPIANLKVYILGHNKEFFLSQFKVVTKK
ncbi:cell death abnormality protein 1-like [Physella acuta]|uniref:cell death abnormality protein 1-like n=1 Tax=Physella acuta TaxID=109671 RepID=UPI0027DB66B6|nr:cell death abnormality protein 1-like [Physella acuta]